MSEVKKISPKTLKKSFHSWFFFNWLFPTGRINAGNGIWTVNGTGH